MSFLELEGLHVFVTGAAGGIGSAIVGEFLGRYGVVYGHCTFRIYGFDHHTKLRWLHTIFIILIKRGLRFHLRLASSFFDE
jgi:nucleoside-diphosphate-sugar epimerase